MKLILFVILLFTSKSYGQSVFCDSSYFTGIDFLQEENYLKAKDCFLKTKVNCDSYNLHPVDYYLGLAELKSGDTSTAIQHFNSFLYDTAYYEDNFTQRLAYDALIEISESRKEYLQSLNYFLIQEQIPEGFQCSRGPYGKLFRNRSKLSKKYQNAKYLDTAFMIVAKYIFDNSYREDFEQDIDTNSYRSEVDRISNCLIEKYTKSEIAYEIRNLKLIKVDDKPNINSSCDHLEYKYFVTIFNYTFEYEALNLKPSQYKKRKLKQALNKSDLMIKLKKYIASA
jgi:hypothetical protein